MPDPLKILSLVDRATGYCRNTPGRRGSIVTIDQAEDVLVTGDLHGHLATFRQVLMMAALDQNPHRHLVLQELVHGPFSYPDDQGDKSHQLVDVVCALLCQYPNRVHVVMGNHELSELTERSIGKNGLMLNDWFRKGVETAYGGAANAILEAYKRLFRALPIAVRTSNRVFICHTIPDERFLAELDLGMLETGEWPQEALLRGGTIYALTWGRDTEAATVDRFAAMVDADLFVTGHQPCDEGFRQANHRQLILDGTDPFPTCCLFPTSRPVSIEILMAGVRLVS